MEEQALVFGIRWSGQPDLPPSLHKTLGTIIYREADAIKQLSMATKDLSEAMDRLSGDSAQATTLGSTTGLVSVLHISYGDTLRDIKSAESLISDSRSGIRWCRLHLAMLRLKNWRCYKTIAGAVTEHRIALQLLGAIDSEETMTEVNKKFLYWELYVKG